MTLPRILPILACVLLPGCVIVDVGVTNPVPGLSRIAVVPFRNLTTHPDALVDGRRFAITYASELQKVPGFEVVPVGVTEVALIEHGLKIAGPQDAHELARILDVDAVVVAAVTDYDPYYPPRVGLQVEWLSPHPWVFSPGVATDPGARRRLLSADRAQRKQLRKWKRAEWFGRYFRRNQGEKVRGQSDYGHSPSNGGSLGQWQSIDPQHQSASHPPSTAPLVANSRAPAGDAARFAAHSNARKMNGPPAAALAPAAPPSEPLMSYSRFFDGADADLVAELRDYRELNGDLRVGSWQAYLQRSDDYIRFVCHRAIEEMLALHGGEGRRRLVFKFRKHK